MIKIDLNELNLEKKISKQSVGKVLKEITFGTVSTEELLKLLKEKN